jgi:hypothetical protein
MAVSRMDARYIQKGGIALNIDSTITFSQLMCFVGIIGLAKNKLPTSLT